MLSSVLDRVVDRRVDPEWESPLSAGCRSPPRSWRGPRAPAPRARSSMRRSAVRRRSGRAPSRGSRIRPRSFPGRRSAALRRAAVPAPPCSCRRWRGTGSLRACVVVFGAPYCVGFSSGELRAATPVAAGEPGRPRRSGRSAAASCPRGSSTLISAGAFAVGWLERAFQRVDEHGDDDPDHEQGDERDPARAADRPRRRRLSARRSTSAAAPAARRAVAGRAGRRGASGWPRRLRTASAAPGDPRAARGRAAPGRPGIG